MNLCRWYFDRVADASMTVEVRVEYPCLRKLRAGERIRFICGRDNAPRDQLLASIRRIYGREKEALGVLAIEIGLLPSPRGVAPLIWAEYRCWAE
jgi:ASC-1-like (ASCH) protein